jgi:hypothetical protein
MMLQHPTYYQLATHTVYTAGRTPEETTSAVVQEIGQRPLEQDETNR